MIDEIVKFKIGNGCNPTFMHNNVKFFISDRKNEYKKWVYSLCSRNLDETTRMFDDHKEALAYVRSIKNVKCVHGLHRAYIFETVMNEYIVRDNTVTERETFNLISGEFESFKDCLKWSKAYINKVIKGG